MSTIKVTNLQNPSASSPAFVLNTDGTCSQLGIRNALINGNPTINQRGYVSGTATTAANEYTLDRWRVVVSGESVTWTDSENVRTVTAPAGGVEQVIEGINILSGTYTLNWTGTATATVDGSSVSKGGNVTLTGGTNCTVRFSNGTFSLAQLEPGSVATPFEHRSYGDEYLRCLRYFFRFTRESSSGHLGCMQVYSSSNVAGKFFEWPIPMRAAPTFSKFGTIRMTDSTFSSGYTASVADSQLSKFSMFATLTGGSSLSAGNASSIYLLADGEYIQFDAEL